MARTLAELSMDLIKAYADAYVSATGDYQVDELIRRAFSRYGSQLDRQRVEQILANYYGQDIGNRRLSANILNHLAAAFESFDAVVSRRTPNAGLSNRQYYSAVQEARSDATEFIGSTPRETEEERIRREVEAARRHAEEREEEEEQAPPARRQRAGVFQRLATEERGQVTIPPVPRRPRRRADDAPVYEDVPPIRPPRAPPPLEVEEEYMRRLEGDRVIDVIHWSEDRKDEPQSLGDPARDIAPTGEPFDDPSTWTIWYRDNFKNTPDDKDVAFKVFVRTEAPIDYIDVVIDGQSFWPLGTAPPGRDIILRTPFEEFPIKTDSPVKKYRYYVRARVRGEDEWFVSPAYEFEPKPLKILHRKQPTMFSPYQEGAIGRPGYFGRRGGGPPQAKIGWASKDSLYGLMKKPIFGGAKIRKEAYRREKIPENPALSAAINKGKRILNKYAKAEYTRLFQPLKAHFEARRRNLMQQRRDAMRAARDIRREIRRERGLFKSIRLVSSNADLVNFASNAARTAAIQHNGQLLRDYMTARDKYEEDFNRALDKASDDLRDYLEKRAKTVAIGIARRFKFPLAPLPAKDKLGEAAGQEGAPEMIALYGALFGYATEIAEQFVTRGRTWSHGVFRGLQMASASMTTFGSAWNNFLYNIWAFLTGPWIWGTLFVMLQFFFILTYIGYSLQYLWVMPFIAAIFTLILNISDTIQPLDWLTHLISGAMIGYSALLFMLALYLQKLSWMGSFWFFIIWAALGTLGLFQFYQTGGFRTILIGSILILLFAWIALGPYSGYYQLVLDQVSQPLEIAYRAISRAVSDIWLLATNPTEWYARQQLVNVRPERVLAFPKGVEPSTLDSIPPSVPGDATFALTAVLKNEGTIEARDIAVNYTCNQWCRVTYESGTSGNVPTDFIRNHPVSQRGEGYVVAGSPAPMLRGEATTVTIPNFAAYKDTQRAAEFRTAKVTFNVSYTTSTNSTLLVDVITEEELNRRFKEGEDVFRNVVAVAKNTPAQISLNVGPQPLRATKADRFAVERRRALLLVSISNQRDDSTVILEPESVLTIIMQRVIGHNLECTIPGKEGGGRVIKATPTSGATFGPPLGAPADTETLSVPILERREIPEFDFQAIYAFTCEFEPAFESDVVGIKTGVVTAELRNYRFMLAKEKLIPVSVPLGILADPFDNVCRQCTGRDCSVSKCHALSDRTTDGNKCWYDDKADIKLLPIPGQVGEVPGIVDAAVDVVVPGEVDLSKVALTQKCKSCRVANPSCDIFPEVACGRGRESDTQCGLDYCKWNSDWIDPVSGVKNGRCEGEPPEATPISGGAVDVGSGTVIGQRCSTAGICTGVTGQDTSYKTAIEDAVRFTFPSSKYNEGFRVVGAVMRQESLCNQFIGDAPGTDGEVLCSGARAVGLTQVLPSTAVEIGIPNVCVTEDNVKAGAKYLYTMYFRYDNLYGQQLRSRLSAADADRELWKLAFAAYNAGPYRVGPGRWGGGKPSAIMQSVSNGGTILWQDIRQYLPGETQTYVENVYQASFVNINANNNCYLR